MWILWKKIYSLWKFYEVRSERGFKLMLIHFFSSIQIWLYCGFVTSTLVLTWSPGGMIREIIEVPLPLAACRDLINFLTFHISTFLSDEFSSAILTNFIYLFSDWNCNKRNGSDTDLQIKRKNTWNGIIIMDLVNSNLRLNTIKGDKRIPMVFNGKLFR